MSAEDEELSSILLDEPGDVDDGVPTLQAQDETTQECQVDVGEDVSGRVVVEAPYFENGEAIQKETASTFSVGTVFDSKIAVYEAGVVISNRYLFTVRKKGRNTVVCSRATTSASQKKEAGELVLKKKDTSLVTNCPYGYSWSEAKALEGKVKILRCNGYHNHDCNVNSAAASQRKSGHMVSQAKSTVTQILAPYILSKRPLPCNLIRWTIMPYVAKGVVLNSKTIGNIMTAVKTEINKGRYILPPPIQHDAMAALTEHDITSENCAVVLKDLIANSDGECTWIVSRLMIRLAEKDDYFDFRIHYDKEDEADVVTWQVGVSRGSLIKYHRHIFLDARKNENMNTIRMRYLSFVIIDPNFQFIPASESFVFEESLELYQIACGYTLDMTPGVTPEMVQFGVGDYFLLKDPTHVQTWFPNIIFTCDPYHFCSAKNKTSVLGKDFGPTAWGKVKAHFTSATTANTKQECLVCYSFTVPVASLIQLL